MDNFIECVVLMVAIEKKTNKECYVALNFKFENESVLPKNNRNDIMQCVKICNQINNDQTIEYIDMFGIIRNNIVEQWEMIDDAI